MVSLPPFVSTPSPRRSFRLLFSLPTLLITSYSISTNSPSVNFHPSSDLAAHHITPPSKWPSRELTRNSRTSAGKTLDLPLFPCCSYPILIVYGYGYRICLRLVAPTMPRGARLSHIILILANHANTASHSDPPSSCSAGPQGDDLVRPPFRVVTGDSGGLPLWRHSGVPVDRRCDRTYPRPVY